MLLTRFQFDLPPSAIAQYPPKKRGDARLLCLDRRTGDTTIDRTVASLADSVRPGDCWVINDTRVRPARVLTRKPTGGRVELLILSARGAAAEAMYRSSKPLKPGQVLVCEDGGHELRIVASPGGGIVHLDLGDDVERVLARAGRVPLPPYIDRPVEPADVERYQTVYADEPGAVAAPTAGLHFTDELLKAMSERGAAIARVTLHVGPGTFRPIRAEDVRDHEIHAERYRLSAEAAQAVNEAGRVVAVGTTAVRTLEACAVSNGRVAPSEGETRLYILPGYEFRVVDALLTNFHLPGSSLLVLVSAFAGLDPTLAAYRQAVAEGFRFYSYGDAMLIS